ncbi:non-hydrolyzing UDP-N-acetylglucosamine 2-epimerase [Paenibacillus apiarius]|uniref:UDP-N-acetylglucosamine 2-epimerase (Non-hydrolyzing) n=1 Tax=Paenibacillus apiarius TaxID=46240 RepID=A0ABT4DYM2_9BACL|nr:UDP-N-acetylglucosamine 2-epimerase (non-hydrolyzing) [Paenibacillus apiarius]MBN3525582.1 UDP-N-acetylglucosamine 2-epimerase (non-hydrolyzing) [Paenibacillus apiarius]MCY9516465.1 UDP-N-acetylglucosamine 2-epimerase (non-hydrolyzing) [Paenibacillus apiarius]MCY9522456.1 UDP-N-acetylglucosamine 2-epimerase (non-hydrolyzing) [Paenibacillus apiarius]MCY9554620.1 UDP-N-acetylglucosamine 2-epimerase (non-hydrolyzing) [Paenibacillus apiarius]MCY9556736.1 UDP-N-acetylglucosamine 2-epimerase (non
MRVMTILGTRPEIIRLSVMMKKLDRLAGRHVIVHTGQNFTHTLSDIFFEEMQLRQPDYVINHKQQSFGGQLASMFEQVEIILEKERPDKVLLLGDTNSALSAIMAERMGIPVVHMEAGNRCFDLAVPEEKNRRVIDAISSINMPYTDQSKRNLIREGIPSQRIVVTGNPIYEVLLHYQAQINASPILEQLQLQPQQYFIVTAHRAENVDNPDHLSQIVHSLNTIAKTHHLRLIFSIHPRTRSKLTHHHIKLHPLVECYEPFGFFDFVRLEQHARCAITDSGTVQEECCIFQVPTVTIRNSTERPETVDCGSNVISGLRAGNIVEAVSIMMALSTGWSCPDGYVTKDVSDKVVKFLLGGNIHV